MLIFSSLNNIKKYKQICRHDESAYHLTCKKPTKLF